ncbi:MAG: glycoside hydrolase family 97 catalytic domain-containing protein [Bacteroidaceae bacterium]|nr:glycoside hydrolase family 97 catalytic domain-containing protein [Bacteroidaceae bacterium]MBQ9639995.1 glycoside hydrolase family 97 catalytic domain-containing protein [Bacteroidaceae bacterium]
MKHKILSLSLLACCTLSHAQLATVSSPDSKLKVTFDLKAGSPVYAVTYDGQRVLDPSPLGFVANIGDFSQNLTLQDQKVTAFKSDYTLDRSKVSQVHVEANQLTLQLKNRRDQVFDIEFRVSNNDIAFRYCIPNQKDRANGKKFSIRVMKEATGFDLPSQAMTFLSPQSDAMIGWKATKPSYEEEYKFDEPMATRSQYGHGYTFPCLFRIPIAQPQNSKTAQSQNYWLLISETGVDSRYCASRLSDMKGDGLYTLEFPMPEENNGNGTVEPAFALPGVTPWRTITVGNSLKPIVETTVPWDYVEPRYESAHQYKYGKGTWSWIVWQDNSICWDDQVKYIQLARRMGYQYVLIDNWWDNNIGKQKMGELVKYAQSQGVDVFLWYSSSGWWNDIEQGPINIMCDPIVRKQYMRWMQQLGVKGIKVDFFGGDKQETLRLYEQILSDADDCGIMVIFHGCTIPRGWERMYPNYVGSEAVLASENIYFSQHFCDVEAQNTALHPFCRNTIGCMEFGGCFMNRHLNRGNTGGNTRRTTDCHELATTVLFQNPIQNFALTPENLPAEGQTPSDKTDFNAKGAIAPPLCMDYLRAVPTTWDETRFIDGYPGKYCVLARRNGTKWYIAGNNATGQTLTLTLDLPMLQKGQTVTLYSDQLKTREPQQTTLKVSNPQKVKLQMADQGGFVIVATR